MLCYALVGSVQANTLRPEGVGLLKIPSLNVDTITLGTSLHVFFESVNVIHVKST